LPLEHCFLGDNVGCGIAFQAALEEVVCHLRYVVVGVVVENCGVKIVCDFALVNHNTLAIDALDWNQK
jgi:hypothetical protein